MNFVYQNTLLPKDDNLAIVLNDAAEKVYTKLWNLDVDTLDISDYTKRYLQDHKRKLNYSLQG